jgi:hypothetical protein
MMKMKAMDTLKGMPLKGQGKPLPPDFPYQGEWLLENRIFLYRPAAQTSLGGGSPEMTPTLNEGTPDWCFGINSMQLAWTLRVGSEEIFKHNRAGTLFLVRTDDVPPTHGATHAKRYIFQIGDRQAPIIIEAGGLSGSA